jgi:hypothetical protein
MNRKAINMVLVLVFGLVLGITLVAAAPTGPSSLTRGTDSRFGLDTSAKSTTAFAGNVTSIDFNASTITQTWQGYFGNITGNIVLGNANNDTFYDWSYASVRGEVYATRTASTPAWSLINCANLTHIAVEDTFLGTNQSIDPDAVNNTFRNSTTHDTFTVGAVTINSTNNCHAVNLYDGSGASTTNFQEVLLYDNTSIIYTSLLTNGAQGFDGTNHNFQMLVGENGHAGDTSTTTYYFYVELG